REEQRHHRSCELQARGPDLLLDFRCLPRLALREPNDLLHCGLDFAPCLLDMRPRPGFAPNTLWPPWTAPSSTFSGTFTFTFTFTGRTNSGTGPSGFSPAAFHRGRTERCCGRGMRT